MLMRFWNVTHAGTTYDQILKTSRFALLLGQGDCTGAAEQAVHVAPTWRCGTTSLANAGITHIKE
jgi:hypothetical protein